MSEENEERLCDLLDLKDERIKRLEGTLKQALRQWRLYANDHRGFDGDYIEEANDQEAVLYQDALTILSPGEARPSRNTGEED